MNIRRIMPMETSPVIIVAALVIIFAGAIYAKTIITPFLLALFISIICAQPISWLEKKGIPRWLALIVVIIGMVAVFSGFTFLIGGTISSFSGNVEQYKSTLSTISSTFIQFLNDKGFKIPKDQMSTFIQPGKVLEFTATALNELINMMGNTFLIFLIIIFMLVEFGSFSVKAKAIFSSSDKSISYFYSITKNVRHYLLIKSLFCLSIGILTYIALVIIGVDYPILWALIAGLMEFIPNIGSVLATVPTFLFALVQVGLGGALWTLGSLMVIHNVLGNIVEPKIMGKGLGLSTLVVFLSLLFWGFVLGPVGMVLSVPFTMTIKIIFEQNEKTRWLAILLGTPTEAEIFLKHEELMKRQQHKKSPLKEKSE